MALAYATLITNGFYTWSDVPERMQKDVEAILVALGKADLVG